MRRLASWMLLLIFLLGKMQVLPLLTAAVAELDAQHAVAVSHTSDGIRVTLHHTLNSSDPVCHEHGILLRAILISAGTTESDHVLEFSGSNAAELQQASEEGEHLDACATMDVILPTVFGAQSQRPLQVHIPSWDSVPNPQQQMLSLIASVQLLV